MIEDATFARIGATNEVVGSYELVKQVQSDVV
jgi:hypothetical protein